MGRGQEEVTLGAVEALPVDGAGRVVGATSCGRDGIRGFVARLADGLPLLAVTVCGLVGTAALVCEFCEVGFELWTCAAGLAALCAVWLSAVLTGRGWPGQTAVLLCALAASVWMREDLVAQGASVWQSVWSWTVFDGELGLFLSMAFCLLGLLVGSLGVVWKRGWLLSAAACGLLLAFPLEGITPGVAPVALMTVYAIGSMAAGRRACGQFGPRGSAVGLASSMAVASLALAIPLALVHPEVLAAPGQGLGTAVEDGLHALERVFAGGTGDSPGLSSRSVSGMDEGVVNRGDLDGSDGTPLVDVGLSNQPLHAVYLASFRGGSYHGGVWDPAPPSGSGDAPDTLESAEFYVASVFALASNGGEIPAYRMEIHAADPRLDVGDLRPYTSVAVSSSDPGTYAYDAVGLGTFDTLCSLGVVDGAGSVASGGVVSANAYLEERGLRLAPVSGQALAGAEETLEAYGRSALDTYLEVPYEDLPRTVDLVRQNPCDTIGEAVSFVQDTLAQNARYTVEPGTYPEGASIADHLLFDGHAGYCQHFATTAALMLRLYGIPTRYVTGFAAPDPEGASIADHLLFDGHAGYCQHFATTAALMLRLYGIPTRYVTGFAAPVSAFAPDATGMWEAAFSDVRAHAWVELFLPGLGWVSLEVTPPGSQDAAPFAPFDPANVDRWSAEESTPERPSTAPADDGPEDGNEHSETAPSKADPEPLPEAASEPETEIRSQNPDAAPTALTDSDDTANGPEPAGIPVGALVAGAAVSVLLLVGAIAVWRRRRMVEARTEAGADGLLVDLVAMLHFAGHLEGWEGVEDGFAAQLAREVACVTPEQARAGADGLLVDLVAMLHFAGHLEGWEGVEDGFAAQLAREVACVTPEQARSLVDEAMGAAFGGPAFDRTPSESARALYEAVAAEVYGELGPLRRLAFSLVDEAMGAAFGGPAFDRTPSESARALYEAVAAEVYGELGPLRRLAFVWVRAYR